MILIGESSSTKTEWCITSRNGSEIFAHDITDGINPYFQSRKEISHIIRLQLPPIFFKIKCSYIHFYGAGCNTTDKKEIVKGSLKTQFRTHSIIESDLLGAARSLFQDEAGIACILGTGSNSCFYDGKEITRNIKSLGYILGDEGSGAAMGKAFLSDCLKGLAPQAITEEFFDICKIDEENILDYIYNKEHPNKLLYTLSLFLTDHQDDEYVNELIKRNFRSFFERSILQYDFDGYPIRFVGKVATTYSDILREVASEYQLDIDTIADKSIDGLIKYHQNPKTLSF